MLSVDSETRVLIRLYKCLLQKTNYYSHLSPMRTTTVGSNIKLLRTIKT
ncbi:hypothetical protein THF1D04_10187 [Vibrio owensii]|uniref:Uncharacterized protein n=1 Tax=Vibrio owensii TaxID=696485 RepID=A0AAU9PX46_9VIBR|nr:hypothetical protein THF1D04_10187 [Vibrio owensii]